ncbi:N-acetylglucosamine-6-phosphate deacetylase [Terrarubrum flagellatum]|uniref:N-acetylglucosamine-6-phosphate deacetylase n=1 Tax=Terrirubrum flagellatum TaxID=2895980 RepID=UPI003144FE49
MASDSVFAIAGRRVLAREGFVPDHAVVVRDGRIEEMTPRASLAPDIPVRAEADIVAPGFIDIQINGAADRLFNDDPSVATIEAIASGARKGGTAHLLPTFITASGEKRAQAIAAAHEAIAAKSAGVLGIHLEGPFINSMKKGAHDARWMRGATLGDVEALSSLPSGATLVTLAPECADAGVVKALSDAGVVVFAGHSDGALADYRAAHNDGLRGFTHLFNAMSQLMAREPGAVGAAFALDEAYTGVIADGLHVAPENLVLIARAKRHDRIALVTDAMPTLAGEKDHFMLDGRRISLREGRLLDEAGVLAGAHLAMDEAVANMIRFAGISLEDALRMASTNPAQAIDLGGELGIIAPGYRASLTLLGDDLKAQRVVVDGRLF